jgi:hypothetical protein
MEVNQNETILQTYLTLTKVMKTLRTGECQREGVFGRVPYSDDVSGVSTCMIPTPFDNISMSARFSSPAGSTLPIKRDARPFALLEHASGLIA